MLWRNILNLFYTNEHLSSPNCPIGQSGGAALRHDTLSVRLNLFIGNVTFDYKVQRCICLGFVFLYLVMHSAFFVALIRVLSQSVDYV